MTLLSHISDSPGIARFEPRPAPGSGHEGLMVWAVDEGHLHNYLLPRNCPRVCFRPIGSTSAQDRERLMCGSAARAVVAVEEGWLAALRSERLYRYILPPETFACIDRGAGYFISRVGVTPERIEVVDNLPRALAERAVELRIVPNLWPLRDAVADSTMEFSIIRMRNAQPARDSYVPRWPL